jgi:hypothetical protein
MASCQSGSACSCSVAASSSACRSSAPLPVGLPDGPAASRRLQPAPVGRRSILGRRERERLLGQLGRRSERAARECRGRRGVERRRDCLVGPVGGEREVARTLLGVAR